MAFATNDLIARKETEPRPKRRSFIPADETTPIFANTFAAVKTDGTISSLNDDGSLLALASIKTIVFSDERLAGSVYNDRIHRSEGNDTAYTALSNISVLVRSADDDFAAGDETDPVYAVDDNLVSKSNGTNTRARVGTIRKVVNSTYAWVLVEGIA